MFRKSIYKTPDQIRAMIAPGLATAASLDAVRALVAPGVTTLQLDAAAEAAIVAAGGHSNFKLVPGYRHTVCTSVNEDVVHGIPGPYELKRGDILSIDVGVTYGGWVADAAITVPIGTIEPGDRIVARERQTSTGVRVEIEKVRAAA